MPRESDIDYYELLGVDPQASDDELRRAWRELALKWHPDRNDAGTEFIFQRIASAYAVLCDPRARAAYDKARGIVRRAPPPPAPAEPIRRAPGVLMTRLSRPLDALLALGIARDVGDGVIELSVERGEADEGGMVRISMRVDVHCDVCKPAMDTACPRCGGTRVIDETFSAWLAVRPGLQDGAVLKPSAQLPNVVRPVMFRVRVG